MQAYQRLEILGGWVAPERVEGWALHKGDDRELNREEEAVEPSPRLQHGHECKQTIPNTTGFVTPQGLWCWALQTDNTQHHCNNHRAALSPLELVLWRRRVGR